MITKQSMIDLVEKEMLNIGKLLKSFPSSENKANEACFVLIELQSLKQHIEEERPLRFIQYQWLSNMAIYHKLS